MKASGFGLMILVFFFLTSAWIGCSGNMAIPMDSGELDETVAPEQSDVSENPDGALSSEEVFSSGDDGSQPEDFILSENSEQFREFSELDNPAVSIQNFFVIGVDSQPVSFFERWPSLGINTLVRKRTTNTFAEYDAELQRLNLKAIRPAQDPSSLDAHLTYLLASASPNDEPEINYTNYTDGRDAQFALQASAKDSLLPFYTNYAGPWILFDPYSASDYCGVRNHPPNEWCYGEYFRATDIISFDIYPINGGMDINVIAQIMARIAEVYPEGNVPSCMVYVEASDYNCTGHAPTEAQTTYQVVLAIISGARGIIYFPHGLSSSSGGGCTGDALSPDHTTVGMRQEMTRLNFALQRVPGTTLQGTINPEGVRFESGTTSGQIRSGTRSDTSYAYYFTINDNATIAYTHVVRFHGIANCLGKTVTVLNDQIDSTNPYSYSDRTVTLNSSCVTVDKETWPPYGYHLYRVAIQ